jgi:hypothetical protein
MLNFLSNNDAWFVQECHQFRLEMLKYFLVSVMISAKTLKQ